jgi:purine-cytosine permease-like protein
VSVQNVFPRLSQRRLSIAIGAVCTLLAIIVPLVQYENFLLLIGAIFVPLFGVLAAHYAVVRRGYTADDLYRRVRAVKLWGCVAWLAGFLAYNWANPGTVGWWTSVMRWLLGDSRPPSWFGASLGAFVVSFAVQAAERLLPKRSDAPSAQRASAP